MFAGCFDHGKAAVLEQEREEMRGAGSDFGFQKLSFAEIVEILGIFNITAKAGDSKQTCIDKLDGMLQKIKKGKFNVVKASEMSASTATSSNDPNGSTASILTAIHESKAEILAAIGKKKIQINHYDYGHDSSSDDSSDDDDDNDDDDKNEDKQSKGKKGNDDDQNEDKQSEGGNDDDKNEDKQSEGGNDDDKNEDKQSQDKGDYVKTVTINTKRRAKDSIHENPEPFDISFDLRTATIADVKATLKATIGIHGKTKIELVCNGKQADNNMRMAAYPWKDGLWFMVSGKALDGGGKRARLAQVSEVDMKPKVGDSEALEACFAFTMADIKKFAMDMDLNTLNKFRDMVAQSKANPDRISTNALPFIPEAVTLED